MKIPKFVQLVYIEKLLNNLFMNILVFKQDNWVSRYM